MMSNEIFFRISNMTMNRPRFIFLSNYDNLDDIKLECILRSERLKRKSTKQQLTATQIKSLEKKKNQSL